MIEHMNIETQKAVNKKVERKRIGDAKAKKSVTRIPKKDTQFTIKGSDTEEDEWKRYETTNLLLSH